MPAENPPVPTEIVLFATKVAVALLAPQNCTPCPFVDVTSMLSLNIVPAEFQLTNIPVLAVGVLLNVALPLKILLLLLYPT